MTVRFYLFKRVFIILFSLLFFACSGGGSDSDDGDGGDAQLNPSCTETDIVGPWIIEIDSQPEDVYIEFGTNGKILEFQATGTISDSSSYTLNSDCTFDGEMTFDQNTYLLEGDIEMEEDSSGVGSTSLWPELDPNQVLTGDMEKVTSISALQGDWEGSYAESGPYGDYNHTIDFSISSLGIFNAFSGLGTSVNRGKLYVTPTGIVVGYIELNNPNHNRYERMLFNGTLTEIGGDSTIEGTVSLDSNETFTTTFSVDKVIP